MTIANFLLYIFPVGLLVLWLYFFSLYLNNNTYSKKNIRWLGIGVLMLYVVSFFSQLFNRATVPSDINLDSDFIQQYFFVSNLERIGTHLIASIGFALLLTLIVYGLYRWRRGLLLDSNDVVLLSLGLLSTQWPNMLIFLMLVFVFILVVNIILITMRRRTLQDRIVITPAIPLAVVTTLIVGQYISHWIGLEVIRF